MAERFIRPAHILHNQDEFTANEVGLTHPLTPAYVRLLDNGDVEIVVNEALSINMNASRRSITFIADQIKFLTKEEGGLRWNKLSFNPQATSYTEPAFTQLADDDVRVDLYKGVDHYLDPNA